MENTTAYVKALNALKPKNTDILVFGGKKVGFVDYNSDRKLTQPSRSGLGVLSAATLVKIHKANKKNEITFTDSQILAGKISNTPTKRTSTEWEEATSTHVHEKEVATIHPAETLHAFAKLKNCIGENESRKNLRGMYVESTDTEVRYIGADAFKVGVYISNLLSSGEVKATIPKTALADILAISKVVNLLTLRLTKTTIIAEFAHEIVYSFPLLDTQFPNLDAVVNHYYDNSLDFENREVAEFLTTLQKCVNDPGSVVKVDIEENKVRLVSQDLKEFGVFETTLERATANQPIEIGLNVEFLSVVLAQCNEDVSLQYAGPINPVKISDNQDNFFQVLMPVKIKW